MFTLFARAILGVTVDVPFRIIGSMAKQARSTSIIGEFIPRFWKEKRNTTRTELLIHDARRRKVMENMLRRAQVQTEDLKDSYITVLLELYPEMGPPVVPHIKATLKDDANEIPKPEQGVPSQVGEPQFSAD